MHSGQQIHSAAVVSFSVLYGSSLTVRHVSDDDDNDGDHDGDHDL